jgi:predicted DCC family thiol-disulfide oxidoreductase YuxK
MSDKIILLYDSECSLCNRFKKAIEMIEGGKKIEYKTIYDQGIYLKYPQLSEEECAKEVHLIDTDGKVYQGSNAVEFLIKLIPAVSKFSWLLDSESSKKAMDMFYGKINDIRQMKKRKCYTCGSSMKIKR